MMTGVTWMLSNFGLMMLVLSLIIVFINLAMDMKETSGYEITFRWFVLFAFGMTSFYAFIMHTFFPSIASAAIGWQTNPFEYEVGMANLAFAVIGISSFSASYGFRIATVTAASVWLWGDAIGHIRQMMVNHNYTVGNAGSWFWLDLILPVILIVCILNLKPKRYFY